MSKVANDGGSAPSSEVSAARYETVPLDCEVCQHIMRGFHTPFAERYTIDLGQADVVLSKPCLTHGPLLANLQERFNGGDNPMTAGFKKRTGIDFGLKNAVFRVEKSAGVINLSIILTTDEIGGGLVECLQLVKNTSDQHAGIGLICDSQWTDLSLLTKWKDCCQQGHREDCEHPLKRYRISEVTPGWLIDVRNQCLVPGQPGTKYITLSYKWGQTEKFRLKAASLADFQKHKALLNVEVKLPETIRNAIDIVQLLGENYLWTDSLCIVQDDESVKFQALNQMAAIYANSLLTIIAADGEDADYGLRGIKGISSPRELKNDRWIAFGDQEKVMKPMFPWHHRPYASYFGRGWTFQEYLFSKRRLIFENQMIRWECSRSKWAEDIIHTDGPESRIKINWMDVVEDRYPSLGAFGYMLLEYNHRTFTYEEDALPAIIGLLSMLSKKYDGGFLCGIPEMYFEAGLNWGPWSHDLKRRTSSGLSSASKSLTILPSWSWIGWEGRISGDWRSNQDYIKKGRYGTPLYTYPITRWYTSSSPSPSENEKRLITSQFLHSRASLKEQHLTHPLPTGWTRHPHDPATSPQKPETHNSGHAYEYPPPDDLSGRCFYTHASIPDIEFWYPIPILPEDAEPVIPPQTPYLFCATHRAFLRAGVDEPNIKPYDRHVWLRGEGGEWVGVLLLHGVVEKEVFDVDAEGERKKVELVAISRGKINNDERNHAPVEMGCEERPQNGKFYEWYNVLWVEWKDGVAYRRGLGRVVRDVWESLELEEISLVLG